jgi:hypothetical protein
VDVHKRSWIWLIWFVMAIMKTGCLSSLIGIIVFTQSRNGASYDISSLPLLMKWVMSSISTVRYKRVNRPENERDQIPRVRRSVTSSLRLSTPLSSSTTSSAGTYNWIFGDDPFADCLVWWWWLVIHTLLQQNGWMYTTNENKVKNEINNCSDRRVRRIW